MTIPDVPVPNADLADIRQKWLRFCSHDTGLPYPCICPTEDHRPVIAALVGEVETLRAEVARLEQLERQSAHELGLAVAERDEAQALLRLAPHHQQQVVTLEYELMQARAEVMWLTKQRDEARANAAEFARHTSVMFQDCLDHRLMVRAMRPVVEALAELVGLKDGPRGPDYEQRKPLAWQTARDRLAAVAQMAPSTPPPDVGVLSTEDLKFIANATGHSGAIEISAEFDDAPSTPPSTPESDGQGELAVTDAVEAPGGAEACACGHLREYHTWHGGGCQLCFGCLAFQTTASDA